MKVECTILLASLGGYNDFFFWFVAVLLLSFIRTDANVNSLFAKSHGSRLLRLVAVDAELEEDGSVLDHCSQRPNQPWQVGQEVLLFDRVKQDLIIVSARALWSMRRMWLTPMPYVRLPKRESRKNNKDRPSQDCSRQFL